MQNEDVNRRYHWCGNPYLKAFPIGEGGSRVPRKRETDEGFLQHANI